MLSCAMSILCQHSQDDVPSLQVKHLPTLDEQPAHSQADTLTNKARQSPSKPGAVARYVGGPILDNNVQPLTFNKPGKTEQPTPDCCKDDQPDVQPSTASLYGRMTSPPHSHKQQHFQHKSRPAQEPAHKSFTNITGPPTQIWPHKPAHQ